MKRAISISIFDQGVLSAQSLLVGLYLIRFGDAESVGRFALSMSLYFALLTAQDSLFGVILANRVFGRSPEEQKRVVGLISSITALYFHMGALLIAVCVCLLLGFDQTTTFATLAMITAGLLRELARAIAISINAMKRCFTMDLLAAVLTLAALPVLIKFVAPDAACLFAIAIGHGTAFFLFKPKLHFSLSSPRVLLKEYAPYFPLTRWSFIGNFSSEVQSRTFLFLVEIFRGFSAIATLHIGRLVISPVMLIVMAVVRILLPRLSNHFRENRDEQAYSILRKMALLLIFMTALYSLVIYFSWPLLDQYLFRGAYPGIAETMTVWCVYVIVSSPLWSLHMLFRATERFRELALVKFANASGVLLVMSILMLDVPVYTTVLILIAGNIVSGSVLVRLALTRPAKAENQP